MAQGFGLIYTVSGLGFRGLGFIGFRGTLFGVAVRR